LSSLPTLLLGKASTKTIRSGARETPDSSKSQLIAAGSGPSKAVETELAKAVSSKLLRQIRRIRPRK
jgi:hypothetical protein